MTLRDLMALEPPITQPQALAIINKRHRHRPISARTLARWCGPKSTYCPAWAIDIIKKHRGIE